MTLLMARMASRQASTGTASGADADEGAEGLTLADAALGRPGSAGSSCVESHRAIAPTATSTAHAQRGTRPGSCPTTSGGASMSRTADSPLARTRQAGSRRSALTDPSRGSRSSPLILVDPPAPTSFRARLAGQDTPRSAPSRPSFSPVGEGAVRRSRAARRSASSCLRRSSACERARRTRSAFTPRAVGTVADGSG